MQNEVVSRAAARAEQLVESDHVEKVSEVEAEFKCHCCRCRDQIVAKHYIEISAHFLDEQQFY